MTMITKIEVVVFGDVTLDVLGKPVNEVPRYECLSLEEVDFGPGGCGSNVAIGLCTLGHPTALVGRVGQDAAAAALDHIWEKVSLDTGYIRRISGEKTGVGIGLVDNWGQQRFLNFPGVNAQVSIEDLNIKEIIERGAQWLHIAGFFALPGLLDGSLPGMLVQAQESGLRTSLDVVMKGDPGRLSTCLPFLDIMLCNSTEARWLTGEQEPARAAQDLKDRGCRNAIVKLGEAGCVVAGESWSGLAPAEPVLAFDKTGAGDAFAAGLIAALLEGKSLPESLRMANKAGERIVGALGAISGWFNH